MLWKGRRQSDNFEDAGRGGGFRIVGGGIGALVLAVIVYFLGGDPSQILQQSIPNQQVTTETTAKEKEDKAFVLVVLAETEDVWNKLFPEKFGVAYREPKLVTFQQSVASACGGASSATGPFYCPADEKLYVDLSFYNELKQRFNAPGDFAMAYVIAHEVGHHIQHVLGVSDKVQKMRGKISETEYNQLSVRLELQADFYAGVWAHYAEKTNKILEVGDIEEALNAANAIGDDRLQQQTTGEVVPDAFTHGTSAQRMYWFKKGYESGNVEDGDTFSATTL